MGHSSKSPLEERGVKNGRNFPNLLGAREVTTAGLEDRRPRLAELAHDPDASVVLMEVWGTPEGPSREVEDFAAYFDLCADEGGLHRAIAIVLETLAESPATGERAA